ncbi:MAG: hypothetical protein JXR31_08565 [Prolixibacteraceae bacterium]|nr:hypothetical protein [Prolixibacteraceae bacterium]MBN2774287.1 hypothetical protein [Prolixibacteraceae bacterium]
MIKNQKFFFTLTVFLLILLKVSGTGRNTKNTDWEVARQENGIVLSYRWILSESKNEFREMKVDFNVDASIHSILQQFRDSSSFYKWAVGTRECRILEINDQSWLIWSMMDYPWPFKQKDLVANYKLTLLEKNAILLVESEPGKMPEMKGVERIRNYRCKWQFIFESTGKTHVTYQAVSFSKPVLPRFLQDPVIQKMCLDSIEMFKQMAEAQ